LACFSALESFIMPGGTHPPLTVILSWPNPNYVNPPRHGWGLTIGIVVISALAVLTVCARMWARLRLQKNGGIDDVFIVAALVGEACQYLDNALISPGTSYRALYFAVPR
jgi:hypothetical protein